jgi:hypothetical protein
MPALSVTPLEPPIRNHLSFDRNCAKIRWIYCGGVKIFRGFIGLRAFLQPPPAALQGVK